MCHIVSALYKSSRISENVTVTKADIIKTKRATIAFFSSLFLFLLSFSFVSVILELLGLVS